VGTHEPKNCFGIKEEVSMIEEDDDDTTSEASKIRNSNSDDDKSDLAMLNALIQTMDPVRYSNF
jgi:hypothetical protein